MNAFIDNILFPLKVAVAWIMVGFHSMLTSIGMDPESGATWALSIVGLVIVIRILLIPLFVKQIKASRGMQLLAPEMQVIQKKYKGKTDPASREAMSRETMDLYKKHGTNPFSSCLPILAQSPIFFALFRVLYSLGPLAAGKYPTAENPKESIGPLTKLLAGQANDATLFGAPISSFFLSPSATGATRIVSIALIALMSVTTFTTQRQLTQKNMPASALQGPMAQQQKMLLYILPVVFAVSGVNFPIGVLIYWSTTNLWSMGQQFYVIRRNPTPGSEAERALKERRARKAASKGIVLEEDQPQIDDRPRGQREQPRRKDRIKPSNPAAESASVSDSTPQDLPEGTGTAATPPTPPKTTSGPTKPATSTGGAKTGDARTGGAKTGGARTGGARTDGARTDGARTDGAATGGARTGGAKKSPSSPVSGGSGQAAKGTTPPSTRKPRTPKK